MQQRSIIELQIVLEQHLEPGVNEQEQLQYGP